MDSNTELNERMRNQEILFAAEENYDEALRHLEKAREEVFEARMTCFIFNAFDASNPSDKTKVRQLLLELADAESPYGKYARKNGTLRTVIDSAVRFFNLLNASTDQYLSVFKLLVADEDKNTAYVVTMTYKTGEASIEAKVVDY